MCRENSLPVSISLTALLMLTSACARRSVKQTEGLVHLPSIPLSSAPSPSSPTFPDERDRAVLTAVLADLITFDETGLRGPGATRIVVEEHSPGTPATILRRQVVEKALHDAGLPASEDVVGSILGRQVQAASLAQLCHLDERFIPRRPPSPEDSREFTVPDPKGHYTVSLPLPFDELYPGAHRWAAPTLPGYSPDGQTALVAFWCGPSPHGAFGIYVLRLANGKWEIRWRHVAEGV
jgi:hypothetical protein